ncbi:MAG TPA: hypothetical protein VFN76_09915 [Candidatus Limnocylindria bacterium]|nr:hypothetical protein [Candidatus Limnocylindria bacterium]
MPDTTILIDPKARMVELQVRGPLSVEPRPVLIPFATIKRVNAQIATLECDEEEQVHAAGAGMLYRPGRPH